MNLILCGEMTIVTSQIVTKLTTISNLNERLLGDGDRLMFPPCRRGVHHVSQIVVEHGSVLV